MQDPNAAVLAIERTSFPGETDMAFSLWRYVRALREAVDFDNEPDGMVAWILPDGHKTTVEMGQWSRSPERYEVLVTQRSLADPRYSVSVWGSWSAAEDDFRIDSAAVYTPVGMTHERDPQLCLGMGYDILRHVMQARREGLAMRLVSEDL
jgi:hypothetical protein